MTIPFLSFLKKKPPLPIPAYVAVEKSETERLSKTVMPNATRTMGAQDPFDAAAAAGPAAPVVRPVVSFRTNDLPPAVALALEPRVERTISVELADVVAQMPPGLTRPLADGDAEHILLNASEVEKGMASGKPTVSAYAVYLQAPEIFLRTITNADIIQVALPFGKVLDQFSRMQVRADQSEEQVVPQVQTPFLQVTLEDDERFGTVSATPSLHCQDLPQGRLETATAESLAAANPEAAASDTYVPAPSMQFPAPKIAGSNGAANKEQHNAHTPEPTPVEPKPVIPTPIQFKLSPKGTDAPALERVPASSGPSVPTSAAAPASPVSAPTRIPFKLAAPVMDTAEEGEPWLTKDNFVGEAVSSEELSAAAIPAVSSAGNLKLPLRAILQNVPPLQLTREVTGVSEDAKIEIPFALLQPQLASGRVSLTPELFAQYLPAEYRELFDPKMSDLPVALPLQEVLKHLPDASLPMREDQVEQEEGENFVTPFSTKAEEDAVRFKVSSQPIAAAAAAKVAAEPVAPSAPPEKAAVAEAEAELKPSPVAMAAKEPIAAEAEATTAQQSVKPFALPSTNGAAAKSAPAKSNRTALQVELKTDEEVDAKAVVAHVTRLTGMKACAIVFGDGLSLAGNLPEQYQADGLCAMAPALLQRVENHMSEAQLGAFCSMSLSCAKATVTFFLRNNLCLAAVHEEKALPLDIRAHLARVLLELSHKYSHPA